MTHIVLVSQNKKIVDHINPLVAHFIATFAFVEEPSALRDYDHVDLIFWSSHPDPCMFNEPEFEKLLIYCQRIIWVVPYTPNRIVTKEGRKPRNYIEYSLVMYIPILDIEELVLILTKSTWARKNGLAAVLHTHEEISSKQEPSS